MNGISISDAMKGVIAAQTEKDDSTSAKTYAATDLIQLYANDGTPNGKINRTDFMNAVQASLGSILNGGTAQTTGITKVPSLVGNALGATTVANLASVLGGLIINKTATTESDANNFETGTGYRLSGGINVAHKPSSPHRMVIYTYANDAIPESTKFQIALIADGSIAGREYDGSWSDWSTQ